MSEWNKGKNKRKVCIRKALQCRFKRSTLAAGYLILKSFGDIQRTIEVPQQQQKTDYEQQIILRRRSSRMILFSSIRIPLYSSLLNRCHSSLFSFGPYFSFCFFLVKEQILLNRFYNELVSPLQHRWGNTMEYIRQLCASPIRNYNSSHCVLCDPLVAYSLAKQWKLELFLL